MTTTKSAVEAEPHLWLPYTQMQTTAAPLAVARAEGATITLEDGRVLVDGIASWWTACHGYRHPHITAALSAQLETLHHVMLGGLVHPQAKTLAKRLAGLLPGFLERVFFAESGSVAVEVAMKIAVQTQRSRGEPSRHRFVSFLGGYHGDTFATMSVCDPEEGMHHLFRDVLAPQFTRPLPTTTDEHAAFAAFLNQERHQIAAVVLEPLVQCAGGMRFHSPEDVRAIKRACDASGTLLIFDEIATGFGRTGTLFAAEACEVVPDIITLSKALTGGTLPLSCAVATREVFETFLDDDPLRALMHGPTFMGNALACAAANASVDLFESEPRVAQAKALEEALATALAPCRKLSDVIDVRCRGAIGVVELDALSPARLQRLRDAFVDRGAWIRPLGRVVYLMPPLNLTSADLDVLARALFDGLSATGSKTR